MCGIAGGYQVKIDGSVLVKMTNALRHRGPDDSGQWLEADGRAGLAHTRLSIIDLTAAGHQPMMSTSGRYVITFNGEIYNYKAVRAHLAALGAQFQSNSDTEVLLAAFEHWGPACLNRFEGMFAFALYDRHEDTLLLARDRFGEKPLYYHLTAGGGIWFASELRALLASEKVPAVLNRAKVAEWLALQTVHYPNTLLDGIFMLPPASFLQLKGAEKQIIRYWNPVLERTNVSEKEAHQHVRELLIRSIEQRLVSDVPVGAFLSGGIDSTVLVGVASTLHKQFNTYTVAFDDAAFRDGYYAGIAAKTFGTQHHEIKLSLDDVLHQVPEAVGAIDHPSADGINSYIVSKAVRSAGIKVALSGLGGDELFGGYASFQQLASIPKNGGRIGWMPRIVRSTLGRLAVAFSPGIGNRKRKAFLMSDLSMEGNYLLTRRYFFDDQIQNLVGRASFDLPKVAMKDKAWPYSVISRWEMDYYMHDVLLRDTDQMSMQSALEVRCPFLDSSLTEYVWKVQDDLKRPGKVNKTLLVQAMRDFIPDELVNRPKQGFSMPFDRWMRNELRDFCETSLADLQSREVLAPGAVDDVWRMYLHKHPSLNWARVWMLVSLSQWMKTHGVES